MIIGLILLLIILTVWAGFGYPTALLVKIWVIFSIAWIISLISKSEITIDGILLPVYIYIVGIILKFLSGGYEPCETYDTYENYLEKERKREEGQQKNYDDD